MVCSIPIWLGHTALFADGNVACLVTVVAALPRVPRGLTAISAITDTLATATHRDPTIRLRRARDLVLHNQVLPLRCTLFSSLLGNHQLRRVFWYPRLPLMVKTDIPMAVFPPPPRLRHFRGFTRVLHKMYAQQRQRLLQFPGAIV